jgi:hypothetical protein
MSISHFDPSQTPRRTICLSSRLLPGARQPGPSPSPRNCRPPHRRSTANVIFAGRSTPSLSGDRSSDRISAQERKIRWRRLQRRGRGRTRPKTGSRRKEGKSEIDNLSPAPRARQKYRIDQTSAIAPARMPSETLPPPIFEGGVYGGKIIDWISTLIGKC